MAWIVPAVLGIAGLFGQNSANKSAQQQNQQQQDAQLNWATQQKQHAEDYMAPWLQPGSTPFANASAGPRPQGPGQGQPFSQQVMGVGANGPQGPPQPTPGMAPPQPPQQQQQQQIPPQMLQQFMQWLQQRQQQQPQANPGQIMQPGGQRSPLG